MLLGAIADDFTGASDLANTLASGGMVVKQLIGVPQGDVPGDIEAGVVSLKTRSIPAGEAVRQSLAALTWLKAQGCRQFLFKYCSTFNSTRQGNIGPVAEALCQALDTSSVVVCPAFPRNGRTVYQGHLFVKDKLLSESGMEQHPLNPMTDPDIRRWLRRQTKGEIGHLGHDVVNAGAMVIQSALKEQKWRLIVVDTLTDHDLLAIGAALSDAVLITGGSGVALGLPANFRNAGLLSGQPPSFRPVDGPAVVLSGSASRQSQAQLSYYLQSHPGIRIDPESILAGALSAEKVAAELWSKHERQPIAYSTAPADEIAAAQARFGPRAAAAVEDFLGNLAKKLVDRGVRRLVVAGGETSGAVVAALGLQMLDIGPEIDPGVPAMSAERDGLSLAIALKSGNFGAVDFYPRALAMLGAAR